MNAWHERMVGVLCNILPSKASCKRVSEMVKAGYPEGLLFFVLPHDVHCNDDFAKVFPLY